MITEIGDVKRFPHPRQLASWIGMDIREYASGSKSNRFGITLQGNRYLRTAFIEANQRGYRRARLSKDIKAAHRENEQRVDGLIEVLRQSARGLKSGYTAPLRAWAWRVTSPGLCSDV